VLLDDFREVIKTTCDGKCEEDEAQNEADIALWTDKKR
jgi:hypothetical protein